MIARRGTLTITIRGGTLGANSLRFLDRRGAE